MRYLCKINLFNIMKKTHIIILVTIAFAVGEATQAPRFYEYVGSLAPKEQVGTYMGFAFLPVAIGSVVAGNLADFLRLSYLQSNPSMMWYILALIGLTSTGGMVLYNLFLTKSIKP